MKAAGDATTSQRPEAALILFAHGARAASWAQPFEAVAEAVRRQRPGAEVRLAYLEFMAPTLPQAGAALVEAGWQRIEILPMFLGTGGHVQRDLPLLLEELRRAHPGARFDLHAPIGEWPSVSEALAAAALSALGAARA